MQEEKRKSEQALEDSEERFRLRLRQETTMSLKWIAQRLQMGSWTYISNLLNGKSPSQTSAQEQPPLCQ